MTIGDGLFAQLREAAHDEWEAYTGHEFVRQLGAGTLPAACFRRFLTQDYLFLIHFARAYALLAFKQTDWPDIRAAAAGLNAIIDEMPLHVSFSACWGLSETEMRAGPEAPATMLYTRYVIDTGLAGDALDLFAALMPCIAGYGEIGQRLDAPAPDHPYRDWISAYQSAAYQRSVATAIAAFEDLGRRRGAAARLASLTRIFATASRLEADFWTMGLEG
jgi:thiaminase/transcriptional activator TenA